VGSTVVLAAHAAAGLVLVAGVAKLRRPGATSEALALTHVPTTTGLVRLLGAAEVVLALAVLLLGGPWLFGALALAYVGFTVVAERQRRAGRGCGCFGAATTRVGPLHLGVDAVAALVAGFAAWQAAPGIVGILPTGLVSAATTLGLLVLAVVLAQLTLTTLPELLAIRDRAAEASTLPSPRPFARIGADA
jgi:hypothetical protein